jgi:hypothetical protein
MDLHGRRHGGFLFFLFVLHDTLFALRLRYTIEAVQIVGLSLYVHFSSALDD